MVRVATKEAEIPLLDAVKMITSTPARIMKLSKKGKIARDMDADFAVFDDNINIKTVFAKGDQINII